ncbi:MAG TPA: DUF4276 family protein [Terriglobia bacterium]|nr:DUF4276 family protein [Terriglobia bacterium]
MMVWIFVEGESDKIALNALWSTWKSKLGKAGWGIHLIPLEDKSRFFRKIGHRAAEKLAHDVSDLVVGLPDLYPNVEYASTEYAHADLAGLRSLQSSLVKKALQDIYSKSDAQAQDVMKRFHPTALKHDLEVLLLAAIDELRQVLGSSEALGKWRHPVEDQNQSNPPKYVVEALFRTKKKRRYRDTTDAKAVLDKVSDIKKLLYNDKTQLECPVFKQTMDWIATKTGVEGY